MLEVKFMDSTLIRPSVICPTRTLFSSCRLLLMDPAVHGPPSQ